MANTGVPHLIMTQDNEFFFKAAREGRLEIQQCAECGLLRHPPTPSCATCYSLDWQTIVAEGKGKIHSFTIAHRPQDPAFEYPHAVALVDLVEGPRIVADVVETAHDELEIGLDVEVVLTEHVHENVLPSVRKVVSK